MEEAVGAVLMSQKSHMYAAQGRAFLEVYIQAAL